MVEIRSFRDLIRLYFIYQREFRLACLSALILVILGAFLLPPKYVSEARLLVKPGRENATLPIEISDRQAMIAPVSQRDPVMDDEKILTGRPVIRKVAERYWNELSNAQPPQGAWKRLKYHVRQGAGKVMEAGRSVLEFCGVVEEQTPVERLAAKLEKSFNVSHTAGSMVMELDFAWGDPAVAQMVLENWINIYMEERRQALGNPSLYAFYETQGQQAATQVENLKVQIRNLQDKVEAVDARSRMKSLTGQIETLEQERNGLEAELRALREGNKLAQEELQRLPKEVRKERQLGLNPVQLDLQNRLNALLQKRSELLQTYVSTAPAVKAVDESIASLQSQLAKLPSTTQLSENLVPNAQAENLSRNVTDKKVRSEELAAQIEAKNKQISALKADRSAVMSTEPSLARLERMLAAAEKNYALYSESLEKARIDRELDLNRISNIAVVETATLNPARVFPKTLPLLLLALPVGLLVGLVAVYLAFLLDQRLHDGGHVERRFGVPLLTSLPLRGATGLPEEESLFQACLMRLINGLPLAGVAEQGLSLALASGKRGEGVTFLAEQLARRLAERGYTVLNQAQQPAQPGQIALLHASAVLERPEALNLLMLADVTVLVVEAKKTTVPTVFQTLQVLQPLCKQVQGIVINKRQFEIPARLLARFARWRDGGQ